MEGDYNRDNKREGGRKTGRNGVEVKERKRGAPITEQYLVKMSYSKTESWWAWYLPLPGHMP